MEKPNEALRMLAEKSAEVASAKIAPLVAELAQVRDDVQAHWEACLQLNKELTALKAKLEVAAEKLALLERVGDPYEDAFDGGHAPKNWPKWVDPYSDLMSERQFRRFTAREALARIEELGRNE